MKNILERLRPLKPVVGILAKGGAKWIPGGSIITDLIDNYRAKRVGLPVPHTMGSVYVTVTGFVCITFLLLFKVCTVQDIVDLVKFIGSNFTGGEIDPTVK